MTIQDFIKGFCIKVSIKNFGDTYLTIHSEAIRREDNKIYDNIKSTIKRQELNEYIFDSNSMISLTPIN